MSFSYQWLIHIGGSTKQEDKVKKSAGYFGEGFKIASLCALRDYNWNIDTSSSNWTLDVITTDLIIDNKNISALAYEVCIDLPFNKDTTLNITNFYEDDIEMFVCTLNSFFYKENPLIGDAIFENDICGIYYRSKVDKPSDYPRTYDLSGNGIAFAAFQALGSLDLPVVISYNDYINDDRDRNFFSKIDIVNLLVNCIRQVDSKTAFLLLNMLQKYWYTYPNAKYGYNSYYTVVKNLIFRISSDFELSNEFRVLNTNLLTADKIEACDFSKTRDRSFSLTWLKNNPQYKLVQDNFSLLGYNSLEDVCSENNALPIVRYTTEKEQKYIDILEHTAKKILGNFLPFETFPAYKIIQNTSSSTRGYVEIIKLNKTIKTCYGFRFKLMLSTMCLKQDILKKHSFNTAFSTFIHELCHCFGGDKSEAFSYALTQALDIILKNSIIIIESNQLWDELN